MTFTICHDMLMLSLKPYRSLCLTLTHSFCFAAKILHLNQEKKETVNILHNSLLHPFWLLFISKFCCKSLLFFWVQNMAFSFQRHSALYCVSADFGAILRHVHIMEALTVSSEAFRT